MRGAFGQDPEFARRMANERWRRYYARKALLKQSQTYLDLTEQS